MWSKRRWNPPGRRTSKLPATASVPVAASMMPSLSASTGSTAGQQHDGFWTPISAARLTASATLTSTARTGPSLRRADPQHPPPPGGPASGGDQVAQPGHHRLGELLLAGRLDADLQQVGRDALQ